MSKKDYIFFALWLAVAIIGLIRIEEIETKKVYGEGLYDGANIVLDEVIEKVNNGSFNIDGYAITSKIDSLVNNY